MPPKVLGIAGSPVKGGNTEILVKKALKAAESEGVGTEFISLVDKKIEACDLQLCGDACAKNEECPIEDDAKSICEKMAYADAIIIGSPVYFRTVSAQLKTLMDRTRMICYPKRKLENKLGGAIAVGEGRVSGQEFAIATLHNFFLSHKMIVVGSEWYGAYAVAKKGEKGVLKDQGDLRYAQELGRRIAQIVKTMGK